MTLRRTGDWPRKQPLRASTPLAGTGLSRSSTGLSRKARMPRTPKPVVRRRRYEPGERAARKALALRSGRACEIGGNCVATEAHHRVNRSQGGTWALSNLLHACHAHHLHVTTHPAAAREQGWSVRSTADPAATPVWLAGRGFSFLADDGGITPTERKAA